MVLFIFLLAGVVISNVAGQGEQRTLINFIYCSSDTTLTYQYADGTVHSLTCDKKSPFCDPTKNYCVARELFICPEPNDVFPLLNSCDGFYLCQEGIPYEFKCAKGQKYDFRNKRCNRKARCTKFDCQGKDSVYTAHTGDMRLFAMCQNGRPTSIQQCPAGWKFNERTQECLFICSGAGTVPNIQDPKKYFYCSEGDRGYHKALLTCPPRWKIDMQLGSCIKVG